jgi:hypothetical protein
MIELTLVWKESGAICSFDTAMSWELAILQMQRWLAKEPYRSRCRVIIEFPTEKAT